MDKKIGFKLNKSQRTVDSLGLFADDQPKESKKFIVFDEDSDELKNKMGFSGFGKIKARKEAKVPASQTVASEEQDGKPESKPEHKPESKPTVKARQFDLEKELDKMREIAVERRNKAEQLDESVSRIESASKSEESDLQREEDNEFDQTEDAAADNEVDLDDDDNNRQVVRDAAY